MRTWIANCSRPGERRVSPVLTGVAGSGAVALALLSAIACSPPASGSLTYDSVTGVPILAVDAGKSATISIQLTQGVASTGGATGSGGTSGVGGVKATGGSVATGGSTAASTTAPFQTSVFCGDGVRDPVKEECDDGPAVSSNGVTDYGDFCSDLCQVTDTRVLVDGVADSPRGRISRKLGAGRHPTAAGSNGFAVALVQEGPTVSSAAVRVARFDSLGHRQGIIEASSGSLVEASNADPVVAMTPSDDIIVAYTDFNGDGDAQGIAARVIRAGTTTPQKAIYVAQQTFGSQYAADILALSDRVIIAWTDGSAAQTLPDIRYREFSFDMTPLGNEQSLANAVSMQGGVALAALGSSWGAAWRSNNGQGLETTEVYDAGTGTRWTVGAHDPAPTDDIPALLSVDATHHVVVYTAGAAKADAGRSDAGEADDEQLYVAVLDAQAPGAVSGSLLPVTSAYGARGLSRYRPALVRTQTDAFIAWSSGAWSVDHSSASPLRSTTGEDVWLERLTASISGNKLNVTFNGEVSLPRWPTEATADQRLPALVVSNPAPFNAGGSLFAAWDDYSGAYSGEAHPDVVAELAPVPMVRKATLAQSCSTTALCGQGQGPCTASNQCSSSLQCNVNIGPQFGYDTDQGVCVAAHCANGVKDSDETGVDCGGSCGTCTCGDGIYSPLLGEICDEGHQTAACETNCQRPACGDGIVNASTGEQCDDQNTSNTDACLNNCSNATCGDGYVRAGVEACDLGAANDNYGTACTQACKLPACGDGFRQGTEECDDGNPSNTDGCTNLCKNAGCGDGYVQGTEQCDDGNTSNTDDCAACLPARCGDGYIWSRHEQCELTQPGCNSSCRWPSCGNGVKDTGEQCDDGNTSNTDSCVFGCRSASCGDGFIQTGVESCDRLYDPNCSSTCTAPVGCTTSGSCLGAWSQMQTGLTPSETPTDARIAETFRIRNNGSTAVALNNVKLRYWFTKDSNQQLTAVCDAAANIGGCGNVHLTTAAVAPVYRGADTVLEMTFSGSLTLQGATGTGDIKIRITKADASNFAETDDFSFINTTTITANPNMALYVSGLLVWGNEPHAVPFCGDQLTDPGEQCDKGIETADCTANCTTSTCGDGIWNRTAGEACDSSGVNTASCDSDCTLPNCGDGVLNTAAGEICDPGLSSNCKSDCSGTLTPALCTNPSQCLHVEQHYDDSLSDNQVRPVMRLVNNTSSSVDLSKLTLRYWFTADTANPSFNEYCDWAPLLSTGNQCTSLGESVTALTTPLPQATYVFQVTFAIGSLAAGATMNDLKVRFAKTDWTNFDETNDWSQSKSTTYVTNTHITLYQNGQLIWGEEPH